MDTEKTQDVKTTDTSKSEDSGKTFNQEELNVIVSKRVSEAERTFELKLKETIEAERKEAERMAKLSADEREKELTTKQAETMKQKEIELARGFNKLEAIRLLDEAKVPIKQVDFLVTDDLEQTKANVQVYMKDFKDLISEGIKDQLKGKAPADYSEGSKEKKKVVRNF